MNWIWFVVPGATTIVFGFLVWQRWIAPWKTVDQLTREIVKGETPRTFLVEGAEAPRRVALSLDEVVGPKHSAIYLEYRQ